MKKSPPDTWLLPRDWKTPASAYPLTHYGSAAIERRDYPPGHYDMYRVRGHRYVYLKRDLPVTSLSIEGKTWMVDDPPHWEGVQEFAERARSGDVLVAGLGLGLIVHALRTRADIGRVVIVERNADVIKLIGPLLPGPPEQTEIVYDDFWRYMMREAKSRKPLRFPTVIVDLWVGNGYTLWHSEIAPIFDAFEQRFPETLSLWFGVQGTVDLLRNYRAAAEKVMQTPQWKKLWREATKK